MIKSHYTDPSFDNHGFVKHISHCVIDCGVLPGTQTPLVEAYQIELIENLQSTGGTGKKPRNIALFRKVLSADPAGGSWQFLQMWREGEEYDDASAAGSVDVLPDGTVHVNMAFGKNNAAGTIQYQSWEASIPRSAFAAPIERPPSGGEMGPPGPIGPAGPPGTGGIVLFDRLSTAPAWEARTFNGSELIDIPSVFGVPYSAVYVLKLSVQADQPNVKLRAGTQTEPRFVSVVSQIAGVENHAQGLCPGPQTYISTVNGPGLVYVQIVGYQPS